MSTLFDSSYERRKHSLIRPLLGDWAVTASLAVGVGLIVTGVWHWLPRMRSPLLTSILLLNPQL